MPHTVVDSPKTLALIHTVAGLIPIFDDLVAREFPGWVSFTMLDESLLRTTIRDGQLSLLTTRRLTGMVWSAVDAGATAIVVTCSSLGSAVDAIRPLCPIPLFRIDEGMANAAVNAGPRIGVLATLRTTLEPTSALIKGAAKRNGKADSQLIPMLSEGAFEKLQAGDVAGHDAIVGQSLLDLCRKVDVIVLAQASMARALASVRNNLGETPVLTSPELGMAHMRACLSA